MIQAIKGTYDLLPGDVEIWHAIERRLRDMTTKEQRNIQEEELLP